MQLSADTLEPTIEATWTRVHGRFFNTGVDESIKEWANEELKTIQADLDLVLRGDAGYEDFLVTFIGRENERCVVGETVSAEEHLDEIPYDDVREVGLCTCGDHGCALKQGELPLAVRTAASIPTGLREFKQNHAGDPLVLDHEEEPQGARQAWSAKRSRVWSTLRRLETYMVEHRDEPPTDDELDTVPEPTPGVRGD